MRKRAKITVTGVVQGVGFRAYIYRQARAMGLAGYVRNLPTGAVEIVAEGNEETIERLIERARRGPPLSRVENLESEFSDSSDEFTDFSIWH